MKTSSCQACGADIIFFENPKTGKKMPVNAETVEVGDDRLDLSHQVSHFATCPKAKEFRKR